MWVDRQGTEHALSVPPRSYLDLEISPDGSRIAFAVADITPKLDTQVWMHDIARGTTTRLTFERANIAPVWTPDGKKLIYLSVSGVGGLGGILAAVAADGSGQPVTLMERIESG